jgi:hypothetical protein
MKRIRYILIMLLALNSAPSNAEVSIQVGFPHVNIGINLPVFPELVVVPGYPVYYAPQLEANFFFYDGEYWVYQDDNWYMSSWYNGPWEIVYPEFVPVFILRIPVFYYRRPPTFFHSWRSDEHPHWGDHWGRDWERHRNGWDKWDRSIHHEPAPLPLYQRHYTGERYPRQAERQHQLNQKNYRYQPRDPSVQQWNQRPIEHVRPGQSSSRESAPVSRQPFEQGRPVQPDNRSPNAGGSIQQDVRQPAPRQQDNSSPFLSSPTKRSSTRDQESAPTTRQQGSSESQIRRQQSPEASPREQQIRQYQNREPRQQNRESSQQYRESRQQKRDEDRASQRGTGQEKGRGWDR